MFAILGATGAVGFSTISAVRKAGGSVRAVVHDAAKAAKLQGLGCEIVEADLQNPDGLAAAIDGADAVQVIVPLRPGADPASDLQQSIRGIIAALQQARPKRALAISDYGAHVAQDIGMPSLFRGFEAQFRELGGHKIVLRSAEHMHNWARQIPGALSTGVLPTFIDADRLVPGISAPDLGPIAAKFLLQPFEPISAALLMEPDQGPHYHVAHAEGPRRFSANDVAAALSELSGKRIKAQSIPRAHWEAGFAANSVPASLANLLISANQAIKAGGLVDVGPEGDVLHGTTDLIDGLRPFVPTP